MCLLQQSLLEQYFFEVCIDSKTKLKKVLFWMELTGREMNLYGHITSKRFKGGEYVTIKLLANFWLFFSKKLSKFFSQK